MGIAKQLTLEPSKTYANLSTLERAVERATEDLEGIHRYLVLQNEYGRLYPVFLGATQENVILCHRGFCCAS